MFGNFLTQTCLIPFAHSLLSDGYECIEDCFVGRQSSRYDTADQPGRDLSAD
jgi:hypothetical protein